jgi:DNA-directed RNA polymerase specialized sigma24 family protein
VQADAQHSDATPAGEIEAPPTEADLIQCLPGLRVLLLRLTRNPDLSKDLQQDVVESVLRAIREKRIASAAALPAYVRTCAKHAVFAGPRDKTVKMPAPDIELERMADHQPGPLELFEKHEMAHLARTVLAELPTKRDRDLLIGFYVAGKTKATLMQEWSLGKDLFDKVISRARQRMCELTRNKCAVMEHEVSEKSMPKLKPIDSTPPMARLPRQTK